MKLLEDFKKALINCEKYKLSWYVNGTWFYFYLCSLSEGQKEKKYQYRIISIMKCIKY